ncbi:MAG: NADH-quinone oxidoreductase subunit NuoH [Pirellulales bacterium]|nr:NADH-quinone oxidoreductase subunit NuoH [Pirellulales bacterium]
MLFFFETLIKIALLIAGLMTAAAYLVLVERWMAAWIQDRVGPNRVGVPLTKIRLFGLGQPAADGGKFFFKEEFTPGHVDRALYFLGPMIMLTAALAVFAVIPFGSVLPTRFGVEGLSEPIRLVVAPGMAAGLVYVFAVNGLAVYGALLSGWASNNKYSLLGGLRSAAQLVSYELPLGLGILGVVLVAGSLDLETIISHQAQSGAWNFMLQPLGFVIFFVAGFAESGRLPFDLAESEQELVGGYHTEYSGVKLLMIMVSEYLHMFTASFLIVILFFGGWHFWGLTGSSDVVTWPVALLRVVVLLGKVLLTILFFMVARWSWPRFRFDQLMGLAWKVMLPLGLLNLVVLAVWMEYGRAVAEATGLSYLAATAAVGWGTLAVAWLAVVWFAPSASDNRPQRSPVVQEVCR